MSETKYCADCRTTKSLDDFHHSKHRKSGRATFCKACMKARAARYYQRPGIKEKQRAQARAWNLEHPDRYLAGQLKHYFGMTLEQYRALEEAHEGCCAICGGKPDRRLDVDHNHDTGHVRGLLCNNCNRGLGMFRHDPLLLRTAAVYLDLHENVHPAANPLA